MSVPAKKAREVTAQRVADAAPVSRPATAQTKAAPDTKRESASAVVEPKIRSSILHALKESMLDILSPLPKFPKPSSGKKSDVTRTYKEVPSFTDFLPARDFDAEFGVFAMSDAINAGALFEITPVPTEARTLEDLQKIADAAYIAIRDTMPEDDSDSPWILQFYANNERSLYRIAEEYEEYIRRVNPEALETEYTRTWVREMKDHLRQIADAKGIFYDKLADNSVWAGKQTRLRCTLYRIMKGVNAPSYTENAARTNDVAEAFTSAIRQCGAGVRRLTSTDYVEWMLPWLSPKPASTNGDPYKCLEEMPMIDSGKPRTYEGYLSESELQQLRDRPHEVHNIVRYGSDLLAGYDLGDLVLTGHPQSDVKNNCWLFDGMPHRVLTLQELTVPPKVGHLTGERKIKGDSLTTLLDLLEDGSHVAMTIVIRPQHEVREYLESLKDSSKSQRTESIQVRKEAEDCVRAMVQGNKLFPVEFSVFIRGTDADDLNRRTNQTNALLRAQGLRMIEQAHDLFGIHKYVQQLPFSYDYSLDQRKTNRSRYIWASQIARLMPVFGRARGTGNPAMINFNRGAEPVTLDPLRDRVRNAHALIFGPSGSGKSAFLNNAAMALMALYRPRLFILDPKPSGGSFSHLAEFFAAHGLTVNRIRIGDPKVTLNPYANALDLLPLIQKKKDQEWKDILEMAEGDAGDEENVQRDPLGEMEHKTRVMITGGDVTEKMNRSQIGLLREIILDAISTVDAENKNTGRVRQVIPTDVLLAMRRRANKDNDSRLHDMANSYGIMCGNETLAGRLFNTQGARFAEADVTLVEFGELSREGYEAELTVASMVAFDCIHEIVDKYQHERRPTLILHDEVHLQLKRPMLAPYQAQIVKLWRSLGAWYWAATQDFEDISLNAKSLVNNLEWLFALQMSEGDIRMLGQFRELSPEDKVILASATKQKGDDGVGDYAEAVVIRRPDIRLLVRSVLPAITLALAGTEKDEKALRRQVMAENNLTSMLEANLVLADRIRRRRDTVTQQRRRSWER